jgi:guanylate kinase
VDKAFATRGIAVFDIDVQGGNAIKRKFPDAVLIFILPPSMEELERRLRSRGTDADDVIRRRLLAARNEVQKGCETYDYLIINDRLDDAFRQLESIVIAERSRRGRVDLSALRLQPA